MSEGTKGRGGGGEAGGERGGGEDRGEEEGEGWLNAKRYTTSLSFSLFVQ